jgi:hypothetical protein
MKIFNIKHFLRHIAMPTLREFTEAHVLNSRLVIDWSAPSASLAASVCNAVDALDAILRDTTINVADRKVLEQDLWRWHEDLHRAHQMSSAAAIQEFRNVCAADIEAKEAFATRDQNEIALWMLAYREKLFHEAELHLAFQAKCNGKYWKKNRIQPGLDLVRDRAQLDAFGVEVRKLYEKAGGGSGSHVDVIDRNVDGSVQFAIYVEGPVTAQPRFAQNRLTMAATRLVLETAIVYHPSTGMVETVVKGGVKNHTALLDLFGKHVVRQGIAPAQIERQRFDLNALRDGMMRPFEDWTRHGVQQVRLRRATYSPVGRSEVSFEVEAPAGRMHDDASKVALASLKVHHTFETEYDMTGASLIVYTAASDVGRAGHFSFNVFSSGSSTIKNLSERNQPIANAVLAALSVI